MLRQEKALKNLNKALKRGRVKHTMIHALLLAVIITVVNVFTGKGQQWVFGGAAIAFLVAFIIQSFFWERTVNKARQLAAELPDGEVAEIGKSHVGHWLMAIIIFCVLASPYIFRNDIAKKLVQIAEEGIVELEVRADGEEFLQLEVPQLYVIRQHNKNAGIFFKQEMSKFTIVATVNDMKPLPVATRQFSSTQRHLQTPDKNYNVMSLMLLSLWFEDSSAAIDEIYKKLPFDLTTFSDAHVAHGLQFRSGRANLSSPDHPNQKKMLVSVGKTIEETTPDAITMCVQTGCYVIVSIEPIGLVMIGIHKDRLSEWQEIVQKSSDLVQSFIVKKVM